MIKYLEVAIYTAGVFEPHVWLMDPGKALWVYKSATHGDVVSLAGFHTSLC